MSNVPPRSGVVYANVDAQTLTTAHPNALILFKNFKKAGDTNYVVKNVLVIEITSDVIIFFCTDESGKRAYKGKYSIKRRTTSFIRLREW